MFRVGSIYRISHSNAGVTANTLNPGEPQGPTETIESFPRALVTVQDVWINKGQLTLQRNAQAAGDPARYVWCELLARVDEVHVALPEVEDPARANVEKGRLMSESGRAVRKGDRMVLGEAAFLLPKA